MFKIEKLKRPADLKLFSVIFYHYVGVRLPLQYLCGGDVYGCYVNDCLVGGYALIYKGIRSFKQIPIKVDLKQDDYAEFTGYFLKNKIVAIPFTIHLVFKVFLNKKRLFVYSYDADKKRLKDYYAKGSPCLIFEGMVKSLEGNEAPTVERVEALTKWGIFKIFCHRTKKSIFSLFSRY